MINRLRIGSNDLRLIALLGTLCCLAAIPSPERVDFPLLWSLGRIFAGITLILGLVGDRLLGRSRQIIFSISWTIAVLALIALLVKNNATDLSPIPASASHFFGIPTVLFFLFMALTHDATLDTRGKAQVLLFLFALLGATAAFLLPITWPLNHPLFTVFCNPDPMSKRIVNGIVLLSCLASILMGWIVVFTANPNKTVSTLDLGFKNSIRRIGLWVTPFVIASAHLVAWISSPHIDTLFGGILVFLLLLFLIKVGTELFAGFTEQIQQWAPALQKIVVILPPAVLLTLYALLVSQTIRPIASDENIYFYMAKEIMEGKVPYRDFFFAHPPFHLLLPAFLFKIFGYSFILAKLLSPLSGAATGLTLWIFCRRHFGTFAAFFSMAFFLLSASVLNSTSFFNGAELTTLWLVIGVWLFMEGSRWKAGFFLGIASITGIYAMAGVCTVLVLGLLQSLRLGSKQLIAFGAVFLLMNWLGWIMAGESYLNGVYTYHGLKPFQDAHMLPFTGNPFAFIIALFNNLSIVYTSQIFLNEFLLQPALWLTLVFTPVILWVFVRPQLPTGFTLNSVSRWFGSNNRESRMFFLWLIALAFAVQYAFFRELYDYYFLLIYPFLCTLLGIQMSRGVEWITEFVRSEQGSKGRIRLLLLGLLCLLPAASSGSLSMAITKKIMANDPPTSDTIQYKWEGGSGIFWVDETVRTLFWQAEWKPPMPVPGYSVYLWNQSWFRDATRIGDFIRKNSVEGETISGSSNIAPLLALLSGRKLAAREIDTNTKRFKTGMLNEKYFWNSVCADKVRYIVSDWSSYFTPAMMNSTETTKLWFHPVILEQVTDGYPLTLYERNGSNDPASPLCRWEEP